MSKKICFVSLNNLYLTPYINKYIDLMDAQFDVIYWNRHNLNEDIKAANSYSFNYQIQDNASKANKLLGYLRFRSFAYDFLKMNNYDSVILLQTSAGILLKSLLLTKYRKQYIIDIRDYTFENNIIFYKILEMLVSNSSLSVISSRGYKKFLPKHNYINVHNNIKIEDNVIESFLEKRKRSNVVNISYIGLIRFHEQNKKVILKFKNDHRFRIKFIGKNAKLLEKFCIENEVNNVDLIDQFPPGMTIHYYEQTDMINNLYGNNSPLLEYALSNKLYYASKLKIPILVCKDTFMEEISLKYGFGYVFDIEDPIACDRLYDYYMSIDWNTFSKGCNKFNTVVDNENKEFEIEIKKALS
ncbi:glycosyltransferase family protein [Trichococcus shcherbakoviae]|uniref:capsular biosynthesis protein n=1 Tax=Trichococcus shcherbakoviae TaxID=2094020 RepID=UPI002AA67671|nr:capsular biosynthesis protein [Trichococcus shcherbakoviae]